MDAARSQGSHSREESMGLQGTALRALRFDLVLLCAWAACSTPVGSESASAEHVQRELEATVLSTGRLSAATLQTLERLGLGGVVQADRDRALEAMLRAFRADRDPDLLYALAELSYLHACETGRREVHLAAAVYAYALLFPGSGSPPPLAFWDPRLRSSFDLYNRALVEGLFRVALGTDGAALGTDGAALGTDGVAPGADGAALSGAVVELAPGRLTVDWDPARLVWSGLPLREMIPASHLAVRGLRNRYRRSGIGAPFIASIDERQALSRFEDTHVPPGLKVPITAFLRIENPREAIARGEIRARLEIYSPDSQDSIRIDGQSVPLESDATCALAHTLEGSRIWDLELAGFFRSEFPLPLPGRRMRPSGVLLTHPYRPGRVPLVLVHGTASSPARWAELVNEIENDARLGPRYQVWLYLYNSGNPVAYSGARFAESLRTAVAALDPQGRDPALRDMVLLGHSQGGLLVKLAVVESGDRFWQRVSDKPFAQIDLPEDRRERLRSYFYFEPLPFVRRVIFLATPHRGSYLAGFSVSRLLSDLITLPRDLTDVAVDLGTLGKEALALRKIDRLPTSLDNMTPGNPFIQVLASLSVAPGVAAHSIIAVKGEGPPEAQSDGVVRYTSAHLEGVESEKVVRSGHSAQGDPETINEVRRILREHLELLDAPS
jgi:triacylglycerol esterase/lipase EstA (alpha/beta hydrolase family)